MLKESSIKEIIKLPRHKKSQLSSSVLISTSISEVIPYAEINKAQKQWDSWQIRHKRITTELFRVDNIIYISLRFILLCMCHVKKGEQK